MTSWPPEAPPPGGTAAASASLLEHLATLLGRYEVRPGQRAMTQAVARALDHGRDLLIEAGTGTGKTLAYLVPLVASGQRAIIATATRHLQTQILEHDLPMALRAAGVDRNVAVLKGRSNYLCRLRAERTIAAAGRSISFELMAVEAALRGSPTGDRAEVPGVTEQSAIWPDVTSTADNCLGASCERYETCYVAQARRRALAADLVIVNHHLLLADYAVRERWDAGGLLPGVDAIVIDEAHALADVATGFFGATVGERRLERLVRDLDQAAAHVPAGGVADALDGRIEDLRERTALLFDAVRREPHQAVLRGPVLERLEAPAVLLDSALAATWELVAHPDLGSDPTWQKLAETLYALRGDLERAVLGARADDDGLVRWVEVRPQQTALMARPVEVGPILQRTLLAEPATRIFTSATLTTAGRFEYVRDRLGLPPDTDSAVVAGAFDHGRQSLLYVPAEIPDPFAPGRDAAVARAIEQLVTAAGGGVFALFSSRRAMRDAYDRLRPLLPMTALVQGQEAREQLLDRFVAEQPAVLFATMGFWQGVDLPAEALRVVVLDKIPFPPPDDPLMAARAARLEAGGRSSFHQLSLPMAAIALRQGFGRLIRSRRHWGVVAVLDPRLMGRTYGRVLVESLPSVPVTREFGRVRDFLLERAFDGVPG